MIEVKPTEAKWTDDLGKDAKISNLSLRRIVPGKSNSNGSFHRQGCV